MGSMRLASMEACTTAGPAEKGREGATSPSNSSANVPPPVPSPCYVATRRTAGDIMYGRARAQEVYSILFAIVPLVYMWSRHYIERLFWRSCSLLFGLAGPVEPSPGNKTAPLPRPVLQDVRSLTSTSYLRKENILGLGATSVHSGLETKDTQERSSTRSRSFRKVSRSFVLHTTQEITMEEITITGCHSHLDRNKLLFGDLRCRGGGGPIHSKSFNEDGLDFSSIIRGKPEFLNFRLRRLDSKRYGHLHRCQKVL